MDTNLLRSDHKQWRYLFMKAGVGLAIVYYLFYKIGFTAIFVTFKQFTFWHVFIVLLSTIVVVILGAYNVSLLLQSLSYQIPIMRLIRYSLVSWSLGLFVPGKLGELSIVYFWKKHGVPLGPGFAVALMDKLITFMTLSVVTLIGIFIFFRHQFWLFVSILLVLVLGGLCVVSPYGRELIKKYILRRYKTQVVGLSKTFFLLVRKYPHLLFLNMVLTVIKWLISAYAFYLLLAYFQPPVSFLYTFIIICTSIIVSLIPISISGLGIREGVAVYLFSLVGVLQNYALSVSVLFTVLGYIIASLSILLLHSLI